MATQTRNALIAFNSGEWTPKLDARVDLAKYKFACRQLDNAIVESYGMAKRRPGFKHIAETKEEEQPRLVDFKFSETTAFALEFGNFYIRFFSNGAQVSLGLGDVSAWLTATAYTAGDYVKNGGVIYFCNTAHTSGTFATDLAANKWRAQSIYEIISPYDAVDVFQLQYQQINDVVYFTHPLYPVYKLTRYSDISWEITEVEFDTPPLLDENTTNITITPSATTGSSISLTASSAFFEPAHVGAVFQITHDRPASSLEIALTGNGTSSTLPVLGSWEFRTTGTWTANVGIERSYDGSTWERVKYFVGVSENFITSGSEDDEQASYRIVIDSWAAGSGRAIVSCTSSEVTGLARVTGYTSGTVVTASVINAFYAASASLAWREGAWSDLRGYPRAVVLHEQRVIYASTEHQALTLWASATGDFENFSYGISDDDAFSFTLAGKRYDAIQWMLSHTRLLVGTSGDEWSVSGGTGEEALTATNVRTTRQSSRGAASVQALMVNESALFVQRAGKKIREMVYTFEKDGYVTPELSQYAEHLFDQQIVQMAFQQTPYPVLWVISNGKLFGMSYEREQEVLAWHRHTTDGDVVSVCVTPNQETGDDDVWVVVKRVNYLNGFLTIKNHVELMQTDYETELKNKVYSDSAYVYDSSLIPGGGPALDTFTITRFAGKEVSILADGSPLENQVASSTGVVTLPEAVDNVVIGLPYETVLKPMRLDVDQIVGPTQGMKRRISELYLRFHETLGCVYGDGTEKDSLGNIKWRNISFRDTSMAMDSPPPLFTGEKKIEAFGTWEEEGTIILKQTQPLPWSLLAIIAKYEVSGR